MRARADRATLEYDIRGALLANTGTRELWLPHAIALGLTTSPPPGDPELAEDFFDRLFAEDWDVTEGVETVPDERPCHWHVDRPDNRCARCHFARAAEIAIAIVAEFYAWHHSGGQGRADLPSALTVLHEWGVLGPKRDEHRLALPVRDTMPAQAAAAAAADECPAPMPASAEQARQGCPQCPRFNSSCTDCVNPCDRQAGVPAAPHVGSALRDADEVRLDTDGEVVTFAMMASKASEDGIPADLHLDRWRRLAT